MKKKISILIGAIVAIAVLFGAISVTTAYAQDGTPPAPPIGLPGDGRGHGGGRGLGQPELEAAAKVLGITTDELSTALKDGKTLADLATAADVDLQDVQDAISAAHAVEMRARIAASLADETITQEKADWLLEGIDKGYLNGPGFGLGGPHGNRPNKQPAPSTQPANQ